MDLDDASLLSLTYVSSATRLLSVEELVDLVEEIRPRNERLDITGLLLYSGGNIIQTLEGRPFEVETVFADITADERHGKIRVVERRGVDDRAFSSWSMGFRHVTEREIVDIQGYSDFVRASVGRDLGAHSGSAFELLDQFRATAV